MIADHIEIEETSQRNWPPGVRKKKKKTKRDRLGKKKMKEESENEWGMVLRLVMGS